MNIVDLNVIKAADTENHLLIARKDGSSSSRRQRRVAPEKVEATVATWSAQGFNRFWHWGPKDADGVRPVIREWATGEDS